MLLNYITDLTITVGNVGRRHDVEKTRGNINKHDEDMLKITRTLQK